MDQLNLLDRRARLAEGAIKLDYHADGQPCRFYDAQDMRLIITAASEHIGHIRPTATAQYVAGWVPDRRRKWY